MGQGKGVGVAEDTKLPVVEYDEVVNVAGDREIVTLVGDSDVVLAVADTETTNVVEDSPSVSVVRVSAVVAVGGGSVTIVARDGTDGSVVIVAGDGTVGSDLQVSKVTHVAVSTDVVAVAIVPTVVVVIAVVCRIVVGDVSVGKSVTAVVLLVSSEIAVEPASVVAAWTVDADDTGCEAVDELHECLQGAAVAAVVVVLVE